MSNSFLSEYENLLGKQYLEDGYVVNPVADELSFKKIQVFIANIAADILGVKFSNPVDFLNNIHLYINSNQLNDLRIRIIHSINQESWFRATYFELIKPALQAIVGNELVMQLRVNLSIQLPGDASSLLPIHADVWSGDSPYEVVAWIPLVNCYGTKTMYILPPKFSDELHKNFLNTSSNSLFESVRKNVRWIHIDAGEALVFNQNLPHGNIVNSESETRWSLNCRFKSVFSPYGDKKLGEFFAPITLKPASRVGMSYKFPLIKKGGDE
jgi:sporadic carbohydrate cluster 2OG-Fe(II) oxygenase